MSHQFGSTVAQERAHIPVAELGKKHRAADPVSMEEGAPGQTKPAEEERAPGGWGSRRTASQISAGDDVDQRCRAELNLREKEMDGRADQRCNV
jgi:hypothetical protein